MCFWLETNQLGKIEISSREKKVGNVFNLISTWMTIYVSLNFLARYTVTMGGHFGAVWLFKICKYCDDRHDPCTWDLGQISLSRVTHNYNDIPLSRGCPAELLLGKNTARAAGRLSWAWWLVSGWPSRPASQPGQGRLGRQTGRLVASPADLPGPGHQSTGTTERHSQNKQRPGDDISNQREETNRAVIPQLCLSLAKRLTNITLLPLSLSESLSLLTSPHRTELAASWKTQSGGKLSF